MNGAVDLRFWLEERIPSERAVIARMWLLSPDLGASPDLLADAMLDAAAVRSALDGLPPPARAALVRLQAHGGSLPAPVIEREFGSIRAAESYANPRAYLLALSAPPSPAERLFLLGMIQPVRSGHERRYAIPPDLLALLPPVAPAPASIQLAPALAPPDMRARSPQDAEGDLLALLLLGYDGALEVGAGGSLRAASLRQLAQRLGEGEPAPYHTFLQAIAEQSGLLRPSGGLLRPTRAALAWLRRPAAERARAMLDAWAESGFDELASMCGMSFERTYGRDLQRAHRALVRIFAQLPDDQWVSLSAVVAAIRDVEPDYARPTGRYESWGIRSHDGSPLDGFAHWDAVEGAQIASVIAGPLHWLGLADLAPRTGDPALLRLTPMGAALLRQAPPPAEPPAAPLVVQSNFEALVPPYASLYARFQIGRIARQTAGGAMPVFHLDRHALLAALDRGIAFDDIEQFLLEASERRVPQNVLASMREWARQHGQVSLRRVVLVESSDAVVMQQIRHDRRLRFPAAQRLSDTAYAIREGDAPALAERMRKAGYGLAAEAAATPLGERDLTVVLAALEFYAGACAELQIEGGASAALLRRVADLLDERQLNRAYQLGRGALEALRERLP